MDPSAFPRVCTLSDAELASLLIGPQPLADGQLTNLPPLASRSYYRFVHLSDTHQLHSHIKVPAGDFLLHTGDFSNQGRIDEIHSFLAFFTSLSHTYKLLIAGNHDLDVSKGWSTRTAPRPLISAFKALFASKSSSSNKDKEEEDLSRNPESIIEEHMKSHENCYYLAGSGVKILDIEFWGCGLTPPFHMPYEAEGLYWENRIPPSTHILMTHAPPRGISDYDRMAAEHFGSIGIRKAVEQIQPIVHAFGHHHDGSGFYRHSEAKDEKSESEDTKEQKDDESNDGSYFSAAARSSSSQSRTLFSNGAVSDPPMTVKGLKPARVFDIPKSLFSRTDLAK